ncbi:GyrI-like domain-containing protein [Methanolobus sp.]|jgi:effector-binding domain-containing protein|nr:GyrI-like domain-containing protein [Methanolobus sp.]
MEESGFRIAGPSRSLYFNDPNEVPEEKLMTEVQIPVEAQ